MDGVAEGVGEGVLVKVGEGVLDGVAEGVGEGVLVKVGVAEGVGEGVLVSVGVTMTEGVFVTPGPVTSTNTYAAPVAGPANVSP